MADITREQISAIRAYYIGPHKEALRYMVISDILYDALPALLDIAEKVIAEPSDPKPTSDLLSRLAEAQREASARGWYGLDVLLNEAETTIRNLEQPKGGDADERPSNNARHATSLGVTAGASDADHASCMLMEAADFFAATHAQADPRAWKHLLVYSPETTGASEIEELCKRLEGRVGDPDEPGADYDALESAALIRRLVAERDQWQERESETQEALQAIGEDFGAHGGERRTDAMRRLLTEATARAADAEAEVERLRAALKPFARVVRVGSALKDDAMMRINSPGIRRPIAEIAASAFRRASAAMEGKSDGK